MKTELIEKIKKWSPWILGLIGIILIICILIWLYPKPPDSNNNQPGKLSASSSERTVSIPKFDTPVIIPPNAVADFSNPFGYKEGEVVLETEEYKINIRPITLNNKASMSDEERGAIIVLTREGGIDNRPSFDMLNEEKQIVRDRISTAGSFLFNYYQREVRDTPVKGRIIQLPLMISKESDTQAKGYTASLLLKKNNLTPEQRKTIVELSDKTILGLFP